MQVRKNEKRIASALVLTRPWGRSQDGFVEDDGVVGLVLDLALGPLLLLAEQSATIHFEHSLRHHPPLLQSQFHPIFLLCTIPSPSSSGYLRVEDSPGTSTSLGGGGFLRLTLHLGGRHGER